MRPLSISCRNCSSGGSRRNSARASRLRRISSCLVSSTSFRANWVDLRPETTPVADGNLNVGLRLYHRTFVDGLAFLERAADGLIMKVTARSIRRCREMADDYAVQPPQFEVSPSILGQALPETFVQILYILIRSFEQAGERRVR